MDAPLFFFFKDQCISLKFGVFLIMPDFTQFEFCSLARFNESCFPFYICTLYFLTCSIIMHLIGLFAVLQAPFGQQPLSFDYSQNYQMTFQGEVIDLDAEVMLVFQILMLGLFFSALLQTFVPVVVCLWFSVLMVNWLQYMI